MLRASLICIECVIKAALQKLQPNTEKSASSFDGFREQMHFEVIVCFGQCWLHLRKHTQTITHCDTHTHTHAHKPELDMSQQIVVDKQKSGPSTTFIHTHSFVEFRATNNHKHTSLNTCTHSSSTEVNTQLCNIRYVPLMRLNLIE